MTIVVGVAAPDGLILAGDSRTTLTDGSRHRIVSDNAQKVFPICDTIGVATYGQSGIGAQTIAGLMDEFVAHLGADASRDGESIAKELGAFFDARFRAATPEEIVRQWEESGGFPLGFLVAGYDQDGIGRVREVSIPGPAVGVVQPEITTTTLGVAWRGQTDVVRRLVLGFDWDLFAAGGHKLPDECVEPVKNLQYQLLYPITMQDAVDFSTFLIRTTIDMQRFSDGTLGNPGDLPGCGGPLRVLAITREGTRWVAQQELSAATASGIAEGALSTR
jgi:proteasome subunit B (beta)-like protein